MTNASDERDTDAAAGAQPGRYGQSLCRSSVGRTHEQFNFHRALAARGLHPRPDGIRLLTGFDERNSAPTGLSLGTSLLGHDFPQRTTNTTLMLLTAGERVICILSATQAARRKILTKNPSVSVRRGVISRPSSEISAARRNRKARSPRAFVTSAGGAMAKPGWRPRKARTWAPFSSSSTEHVT